jgi:CHAT domain-containing protein
MKNSDGSYAFDKNNIYLVSNTKELLISKSRSKEDTVRSDNNRVALFGNPMYYSKKSTEALAQNQGGDDRSFNFIAGNVMDSTSSDTVILASQIAKSKLVGPVKERIKQLPGAEYEVKDINGILSKKNWKSEVFVFAEADEEKIKEIVNPQVFHIATHGFFMEDAQGGANNSDELSDNRITSNPLIRSGLLLKEGGDIVEKNDLLSINNQNGVLTAYEAMNLNFDNTELVVLSACETGLGKVQIGEGVFGLQRAFLVAGANAVIMSLFKVNDKVTQELMEIFYQKWLDGMNKRAAFRYAKNEIKAKYPQPIYWGSFIMIGGD